MTIERPMFPPRADDTIVQFPNSKKKTKRKSAVTDLPKSGFDLVRSKPPTKKGKAATPEQWAALEFEPWTKGDKEKELFGGENWHRHGVSVRFAYCLMLMSRKEMIDLHGEIDQEQMDDLFANIVSAAEFLKSTVAMMEAVTLRLIASGSAAEPAGSIGHGTRPIASFEGFSIDPAVIARGQ